MQTVTNTFYFKSDNTHYLRKYEDIDFAELKNYLDIFMMQIEVQYKILNPPVARN